MQEPDIRIGLALVLMTMVIVALFLNFDASPQLERAAKIVTGISAALSAFAGICVGLEPDPPGLPAADQKSKATFEKQLQALLNTVAIGMAVAFLIIEAF